MKRIYQADPIVAAIEERRCLPYNTVKMESGWVSDQLRDEVNTWDVNPTDLKIPGLKIPVLINAPTGSGKNTFVQNVLASHAAKQRQYVLLLTNRYVLNLQQKQGFSDSNNHPPFGTDIIEGVKVFGNIIALLYHEVPNHLDCIVQRYRIGYVVFDEAHFFCSDATFNVETCNIFRRLLRVCYNAKRIYMSATPDDVRSLIAYEENCLYWSLRFSSGRNQLLAMFSSKGYGITEYYFPHNYSFVDLHFFSKWENLTELINSQESNEKWLIFVSSKEVGADLKKEIAGSEFIDATYKDLHSEKIQMKEMLPFLRRYAVGLVYNIHQRWGKLYVTK